MAFEIIRVLKKICELNTAYLLCLNIQCALIEYLMRLTHAWLNNTFLFVVMSAMHTKPGGLTINSPNYN